MQLIKPAISLLFVLLSLPAEQLFTQSTSQATESPNFLSAKISSHDFGAKMLPWLIKHPDLATTVVSPSQLRGSGHVTRTYQVTYPTLDIYSSRGVPLFFGDSSETNVKVIDALPLAVPEPDLNPRYQVRPSLREALSMVPSIPRGEWATPAQIDYTIFVVSMDRTNLSANQTAAKSRQQQSMNPGGPKIDLIQAPDPHPDLDAPRRDALANQAQDEAIQRLKTRLDGSRIRVIEVRLEP